MTEGNKASKISEMLIERLSEDGPSWLEKGACADSEIDPFNKETEEEFKKLCGTCSVRIQCDNYRSEKEIKNGVWGGFSASTQESD